MQARLSKWGSSGVRREEGTPACALDIPCVQRTARQSHAPTRRPTHLAVQEVRGCPVADGEEESAHLHAAVGHLAVGAPARHRDGACG